MGKKPEKGTRRSLSAIGGKEKKENILSSAKLPLLYGGHCTCCGPAVAVAWQSVGFVVRQRLNLGSNTPGMALGRLIKLSFGFLIYKM